MSFKSITVAVLAVTLVTTASAQDPAREKQLQQAISLIETKGDPSRAITMLEDVARSGDRALAARALLYMAQAQERHGKDQARRTYERIIRDFGNETAIVAQARTRLAALDNVSRPRAEGGVVQRVVTTMREQSFPFRPVSDDGRLVLFAIRNGDKLELRDLTTGTDRVLLKGGKEEPWEHAVLSRDGKQVAWVTGDEKITGYALWIGPVNRTASVQPRLVYRGEKIDWLEPLDWSPDGQYIAAGVNRSAGGEEIAIISVTDGSRRTLKAGPNVFPSNLSFSPDSKLLAADPVTSGGRDIVLFPVDGSAEIPATVHRADDGLVGWSPDGALVLFVSDRTGTMDLWGQRLEGRKPQGSPALLKSDIGRMQPLGVTTGGSVHMIAAFSSLPITEVRAGALDFRSGSWTSPLSDVVQEYFVGQTSSPAWSPDGQSLAYISIRASGQRRDFSIAVRSLASGQVRELRTPISPIQTIVWAPGGKSLLAYGQGVSDKRGWWNVDALTGEARLFAPQGDEPRPNTGGMPAEGTIVYLRHTRAGITSVIGYDLSSGTSREVFQAPAGQADQGEPDPTVSRDGRKIFFCRPVPDGSKAPFRQVAFVEKDLNSGAERVIATGQFGGTPPSPDGNYIATASNEQSSSTRSILIVSVAGGQTREVMKMPLDPDLASGKVPFTNRTNPLSVVAWAPDSQSVLVYRRPVLARPGELWWVPIDGRGPKRLLDNWELSVVRVHADNSRVAVQISSPAEAKPRQLWVLENVVPAPAAVRRSKSRR